jgi:hypothetical protein
MSLQRRILLSGLPIALGYFNIAILVNGIDSRLHTGIRLPVVRESAAFLNVFPVFQYYLLYNMDFEAELRSVETGRWHRIELDEYFHFRRGELQARLLADAWAAYLGKPGVNRAWAFMGRKIRDRHDRLHPSLTTDRIRIFQNRWPRCACGYWALRTPSTTQRRLIYESASARAEGAL